MTPLKDPPKVSNQNSYNFFAQHLKDYFSFRKTKTTKKKKKLQFSNGTDTVTYSIPFTLLVLDKT